jgi:L-ribulose-5-phosphate 3-epimerase
MTSPLNSRLGVCSWSLKPDGAEQLVEGLKACELTRVQLALGPLIHAAQAWRDVHRRLADAGIGIVSGMTGCADEDYSTLDTIRLTGGLVPDATWDRNRASIEQSLRAAAGMDVRVISSHAGFIPGDRKDPTFDKLVSRVQWVADTFAREGATFLLETGQETADTLWAFLDAVDRPNVGVNFDPANMILYAKGDPIAALQRLLPRVRQVHIKDAVRTSTPGTWGKEVVVGEGEVAWPDFVATLHKDGFSGDLVIEREAGPSRVADIRAAAAHIRDLWPRSG